MPEEETAHPERERGQNRRRSRHSSKATSQRNYASENDVSNSPANPPRTPQKSSTNSPAPSVAQGQGSTKRGNKDKTKPRHLPLSPESARISRQTPPHPTAIPQPANSAAFAGATFHASPAPSSLPLPSFFSKGLGSPAPKEEVSYAPEASEAEIKLPFPTPLRVASSPMAQDSPLEFIFRADREERERARQATQELHNHTRTGLPDSPSSVSPTRKTALQDFAAHSPSPVRYTRPDMARSTPDFDHSTSKVPIGPSFSTPYQERIRAARNSGSQNQVKHRVSQPPRPSHNPTDKSEALKRYLFGPAPSPDLRQATALPTVDTPLSQQPTLPLNAAQRDADHVEPAETRDAEVIAMENNLRRLLKLDSSLGA